jgi:hypothetical protein
MNLFEVDNNVVSFAPEALTIKAFKALWDRDKSKNKKRAVEELSFVFFMCDFNSVYSTFPNGEKEELIKEDIITIKDWKQDKKVEEAIEKFKSLQETISMKLLASARLALGKLEEYFEEVDLLEEDDKGKLKHDVTKLTRAIESAGKLNKALKELEDSVKKEQSEAGALRGGGTKSAFEDE